MRKFISLPTDPWRPSSAGERLLFLLLRHHREWPVLNAALHQANLNLGRRYDGLSDFFIGASLMSLLQRIIRTAGDVREQVDLPRDRLIEALRKRVVSETSVSGLDYGGDLDALFDEALRCAEKAARTSPIGGSLASQVSAPFLPGPLRCYSCDRLLGVPEGDRTLEVTFDHIWPASLGGDTSPENLLPACQDCNETKTHVAIWQMAWIQLEVYSSTSESAGKSVPKAIKMALHSRAAMEFAHTNGTTLRDAYVAIGPRDVFVTKSDERETLDFFNMKVHDPLRIGVEWMPR